MVFEIGYTGNHTVHLTIDQALNYTPAQYLSTSLVRDQAVIDRNSTTANPFCRPASGHINGSGRLHSCCNSTRSSPVSPERQQRQQLLPCAPDAPEKRFANGFQFLANYQWGAIASDNYLNSFGPLEKRPADIDRRTARDEPATVPFGKGNRRWDHYRATAARWSIASSGVGDQRHPFESGGPVGSRATSSIWAVRELRPDQRGPHVRHQTVQYQLGAATL
jgi:hypothetical protein